MPTRRTTQFGSRGQQRATYGLTGSVRHFTRAARFEGIAAAVIGRSPHGSRGRELSLCAKQYEMTFPAEYDMQIIRDRVATRGAAPDEFRVVAIKGSPNRERGRAGASVQQYAPCYRWSDVTAMARFLWGGGGSAGIVGSSFERPRVRQWAAAAYCAEPVSVENSHSATRRFDRPADGVGGDFHEVLHLSRPGPDQLGNDPGTGPLRRWTDPCGNRCR